MLQSVLLAARRGGRVSVEPGQVLAGKYRIERVLGQGGMGVVVVATHIGLDDRVAIKFLLPEVAQSGEIVARFLREGRASRKIQSEHVVRVSDVGTLDNGAPYMVMEYLDGCDLSQRIHRDGPLSVSDAIEYLLQACEAVAEAHALGIVHRDLKPANLFLTRRRDGSPCVKVLDFGISKSGAASASTAALTRTTGMMGSPLYMSPEQLQSARDVDHRTDIWALGIILFELLGGIQPFLGDTLPQLSIAIMMQAPTSLVTLRSDVPMQLQAVIEQCLSKNREERFRSVGAFAAALAPFAPPTARLSIDRIVRVSGSTPPPVVRESLEPSGAIMAAPAMTATPTVMLSTTTGSSTNLSQTSGTPIERRRAPVGWIFAGAGGLTLAAVSLVLVLSGRGAPTTQSPAVGTEGKGEEQATAAPGEKKAAQSKAPAIADEPTSGPPSSIPAATSAMPPPPKPPEPVTALVAPTAASPKVPAAKTASSTAPDKPKTSPTNEKKTPPKNNDDDPTL